MHSDLLMLRVACRVVEGARGPTPSTADAAKATSTTTNPSAATAAATGGIRLPRLVLPTIAVSREHARRIPALHQPRPQPQPPMSADAADLMLGLKRPHADEPDESPRLLKRARQSESPPRVRLPPPPGVFMDSPLAKLLHAPRCLPSSTVSSTGLSTMGLPMCSPLGVEGVAGVVAVSRPDVHSQSCDAPTTFMPFMSRPQMTVHTAASNASASEDDEDDAEPTEKLSPLESPRVCEPVATSTLRMPTLPPWRSPVPTTATPQQPRAHHTSPLPSFNVSPATRQSAAMPPLALPATTKPTLVRKTSAPWRQAMAPQERTRTRERILRGLDRQCRGDYDALLQIVTALEEELLHAHTTSKDHYFFQTVALRDRIATLSPPTTTRPQLQPQPHHHL